MKRSFAALMLLIIPALTASCWKTGEDWSLCGVDDNLKLKFRVEDGSDMTFIKSITGADVYLFDADKTFVEHRRAEKSDLDLFRGITFTVSPGTYYVVCWANVAGNSRVTVSDGANNFENSYIEIVSQSNGCPIYYAPYKKPEIRAGGWPVRSSTRADDYSIYTVEVLPNVETVKEVTFSRAHRTVQVYIGGYEESEVWDGEAPFVEQSNTGGRYNFLLQADPTPRSLRQRAAYGAVGNGNFHIAEFYSALVPVNSGMHVNIDHPTTGAVLASVNIERYIADNNIVDDSVIPIMVLFNLDASVSIRMPSWLDNSITGR